jgi:hypothetical protein
LGSQELINALLAYRPIRRNTRKYFQFPSTFLGRFTQSPAFIA